MASLCVLVCSVHATVENLDVKAFSNGSFSVDVGGKPWFRSGSIGVRDEGQWWSQSEGTLKLSSYETATGSDDLGTFTVYVYTWMTTGGASPLTVETHINVYSEVPAVAFDVVFYDKATDTNIKNYVNGTLSTFPSFVIEDGPVERGYLTWSGNSK